LGGCKEAYCQFQAPYDMLRLRSLSIAKGRHGHFSLDLESQQMALA
jgi:hypothetical protein